MKNFLTHETMRLVRSEAGAVAAMSALLLTVLLGFTAFAIDIGHLTLVKSELQRTADAAALAGARALYPDDLPITDPTKLANFNPLTATAISRAALTLNGNVIDGKPLGDGQVSIQPGTYNWTEKTFTPSATSTTNAVLVQITDHLVNYTFAPVLGHYNSKVSTKALAVMDYVSALPPGTMPIALNKNSIKQVGQNFVITFYPDPSDSGGWFSKPPDSSSSSTYKSYIDDGTCPPLQKGDLIDLNNGSVTASLQALSDLAAAFGLRKKGGYWDIDIPVVDTDKFNTTQPIDSFVKFRVTKIVTTGSKKSVEGTIIGMGMAKPGGKPGGPSNGLLNPPKLVAYN